MLACFHHKQHLVASIKQVISSNILLLNSASLVRFPIHNELSSVQKHHTTM
eukprot:TRINITY_DN9560_c0_g1_i1.p3 TRINITY_DN9560_c0_g1~~TRINITY_DN9560_c0_g1_i1.p3  ORF type:complete len:51 (+),score=1.70 TRINITY_DN9560_c0_g1_i1:119-271(+)